MMMRMLSSAMALQFAILLSVIAHGQAFLANPAAGNVARSLRPETSLNIAELHVFDGIREPVQSYVDIWVPAFNQAREAGLAPDFLLKYGHGAAMGTVLLSMGLIGAYFGWQIRLGNGNDVNALTLGETIREAHPKIAGGALFFFLLGGQGGLVLKNVLGGEILTSPHALTASLGISMFILQALLPLTFQAGGQTSRTVHTYLGTATIAVFFAHMATGIQLGSTL